MRKTKKRVDKKTIRVSVYFITSFVSHKKAVNSAVIHGHRHIEKNVLELSEGFFKTHATFD